MTIKKMLKALEGQEVWTNAFGNRFGERVCVGIEKENLIHAGEKFIPTKEEMNEVWNDVMVSEGIR